MRPPSRLSNGSATMVPPAARAFAAVSSALSTQTYVVHAGCVLQRRPEAGHVAPAQLEQRVLAARGVPAEDAAVEGGRRVRVVLPGVDPAGDAGCVSVTFAHVDHRTRSSWNFQLATWIDRLRACAPTATAAESPARSTSSGSAGRCSSCASCCSGPKRFTDLRAGLPHIGPDVLSQRLRELEESGVVAARQAPSARGLAGLRAHRARARARAGRAGARPLGQSARPSRPRTRRWAPTRRCSR